ncbi:threonine synthase [Striga asiatica]|uniref:Threonine synthase n=1 Tax=Striga asiatica TaxID=4170 RepID=A0A5A7R3H2_STRAF|nr:threonine synthase [Striga asiatica]
MDDLSEFNKRKGYSPTSSDPLSAAASASASLKHRRPAGENIRDEARCHASPHGFSAKYVPFNADPFSTDSYSLNEIVYEPSPRHLQLSNIERSPKSEAFHSSEGKYWRTQS